MNPSPLVSVVIPSYNSARTITRAIQSALEQDYSRLEIVVADDCSADSTQETVRQLNDARITFLPSRVNRGAAATRNRGISYATGTYVAFLDADDAWLPGKISMQVRMMEEYPNARLATCDCLFIDTTGRPKHTFYQRRAPCAGENAWRVLLAYNFIATPTVLARRADLVELGGFSETLPTGEDQDLWIRLAARGALVFSPDIFVQVYNQPTSLSKRNQEREAFLLLSIVSTQLRQESHRLEDKQIRSIWGQRLFDVAANLFQNKEYGLSAPLFWRAASCAFRPIKSVVNVARAIGCGAFRRDRNLTPTAWKDATSKAALPVRRGLERQLQIRRERA